MSGRARSPGEQRLAAGRDGQAVVAGGRGGEALRGAERPVRRAGPGVEQAALDPVALGVELGSAPRDDGRAVGGHVDDRVARRSRGEIARGMPRARCAARAGGQPHHSGSRPRCRRRRPFRGCRAQRPGRSPSTRPLSGSRMVCVPPKAWEGRRKADWTASVVLPLASLRTPRHTAIVWPCALAAKSIPASMKWLVVPIWRIAPQWPEVPRARARIVSGPVIAAARPLRCRSAPTPRSPRRGR